METHKVIFKGIFGTAMSFGAWVVSNLSQIKEGLQVASLVIGVAVSAAMCWSIVAGIRLKKARNKIENELSRLKITREELALCNECQSGLRRGMRCPIPEKDRPANCPMRKAGG